MYILGLDCGGTSTEALLTTEDGVILGHARGGAANYTVGGVTAVLNSSQEAIRGCLEQANLDLATLQQEGVFLSLGVSGAGREIERVDLQQAFYGLGYEHVLVSHDATIALFGALGGADGVVVIAGTGSIAYGLNGAKSSRIGGWGYLLGDEGSAFWIALCALKQVMRGYDGRAPLDSTLWEATRHYFQIQEAMELVPLIYKTPLNRGFFGGFSREITSLAREGHSLSQEILADAGRQLGELALAALTDLQVLDQDGRVGACGGVFAAGDWILKPMQDVISSLAPGYVLTLPDFEPVVGALLMAARHFGLDLDRLRGGLI